MYSFYVSFWKHLSYETIAFVTKFLFDKSLKCYVGMHILKWSEASKRWL